MKSLNRILGFALMFTLTMAPAARAHATDMNTAMAHFQQVMKDNVPINSEEKAANVLIVYAELMSVISDLMSSLGQNTLELMRNSDQAISNAANSPAAAPYIAELQGKIAQLVISLDKNNAGMKNLAAIAPNLASAKDKFPGAKFTATAEQLVVLTQESAVAVNNFVVEVDKYAVQMDAIIELIRSNSPQAAEQVEALAQQSARVQKYSIDGIGDRFRAIQTVLTMMYQE